MCGTGDLRVCCIDAASLDRREQAVSAANAFHTACISQVKVDVGKKLAVSASLDGTLALWRLQRGESAQWVIHPTPLLAIEITGKHGMQIHISPHACTL